MEIPTPNNGATVKAAMKTDWNSYVILAKWGDEWVVWRMDNYGECYWGYYYVTLKKASERFFDVCADVIEYTC